jgi:hypothetical protein
VLDRWNTLRQMMSDPEVLGGFQSRPSTAGFLALRQGGDDSGQKRSGLWATEAGRQLT